MENKIQQPISTFDEIYHLTIEAMRNMELEILQKLKKQASKELDFAKLTKNCIELALLLKNVDEENSKILLAKQQQELLN